MWQKSREWKNYMTQKPKGIQICKNIPHKITDLALSFNMKRIGFLVLTDYFLRLHKKKNANARSILS